MQHILLLLADDVCEQEHWKRCFFPDVAGRKDRQLLAYAAGKGWDAPEKGRQLLSYVFGKCGQPAAGISAKDRRMFFRNVTKCQKFRQITDICKRRGGATAF